MYIPISLISHDEARFDLLTSIVAAEGLAPTDCRAFEGLGLMRASITPFTGFSALNPSPSVLALFDHLPQPPDDERSGTVVFDVPDEALIPVTDVRQVYSGCRATAGSVFFDLDKVDRIDILFWDENILESCQGCLESPTTKNEKFFQLRLLSDVERRTACPVPADFKAQLEKLFTEDEQRAARKASREREFRTGFALGQRLGWAIGDRIKKEKLLTELQQVLSEYQFHGAEYVNRKLKVQESISEWTTPLFNCARMDPVLKSDTMKGLYNGFIGLVLDAGEKGWNWSDNPGRAAFCERFLDECLLPVLEKTSQAMDTVQKFKDEMQLMIARFRNPNTCFVDDGTFHSCFLKSLWAVLYSEGRADRILESVERHSACESVGLDLALFGGMKGYARFPYKQLAPKAPTGVQAPQPSRKRKSSSPAKPKAKKSVSVKRVKKNSFERENAPGLFSQD